MVHRVSMVIQEFASQAQFMVISHREEYIVNAEKIYGGSIQQSGITDIFSVDLEEVAKHLLELEDKEVTLEEELIIIILVKKISIFIVLYEFRKFF